MDLVIELVIWKYSSQWYLKEEQKAGLEQSVRNALKSDAGNPESVHKVLRVKISELDRPRC